MVYWETAHEVPNQPQLILDWARQWQEAEKVVYSSTLTEPRSARTQIKSKFDPDAVRQLKERNEQDMAVAGPELGAQALQAKLVDELQMIIFLVVIGGGKRFLPDGAQLNLELVEERRFANGVIALRYSVRS